MNKFIVGLATLLLLAPLAASASIRHIPYYRHHHTDFGTTTPPVQQPPVSNPPVTPPPTQPPTNPTPISNQTGTRCVNVAQGPNPSVMEEIPYMAILQSKGITCVRIAAFGQNSTLAEQIGVAYKGAGFRAMIVEDDNGKGLSQAQLSSYDAGVIAQAQQMQKDGLPEIAVGNEQEYRLLNGLTQSQWIAHVKTLASQVKQIYGGEVSYDTSGDFVGQWVSAGVLGALDAFGENDYCGFGCNEGYIKAAVNAWGAPHVEVTETNCDVLSSNTGCTNDAAINNELKGDYVKLRAEFPTIPFYFFALDTGGDESHTQWGLYVGTTVQYPQSAATVFNS